jgi:tRNA A-37 threonylcarbamoyl transferase component Bud32
MIGQTLGTYQIVEEIGTGGMAKVYKAYDPGTDRHVAIKVLPDHYSSDPVFRERFQREAKAIAKLEHVHILPIFGYGEENSRAYFVMRYMQTGTLGDTLTQGPLSLEEASRLLGQMAAALDAAHEQGIIHRDVKPSNILLDKHRNAYLSDFGIAKILEAADLTGSGIIGTPLYMSPEQCNGEKNLTNASDQYALAVILYQMITGSPPYEGDTPMAIIMKHVNSPLPDARSLRPDLPEAAARVIERALSKSPARRYASCSEMASEFAAVISGRATTVAAPIQPAAPTLAGAHDDARTLIDETAVCQLCGGQDFVQDFDGRFICGSCGTPLGQAPEDIDCPACGTLNPPQARKCMNCGLTLGRMCPSCNYQNPPTTDICLQCGTRLDRLSSMMMRTPSGKAQATKQAQEVAVKSKGHDAAFMEQQRIRLEEEERQRLIDFGAQKHEAVRQQRLIMTITLFGGAAVVIILLAVLLASQLK